MYMLDICVYIYIYIPLSNQSSNLGVPSNSGLQRSPFEPLNITYPLKHISCVTVGMPR